MMEKTLFKVALPPHTHGKFSIHGIMATVVLSLVPALAVGITVFGWGALRVTLCAVISAVLTEYLLQRFALKVKPSISDGSAVVTGVLLAFNLPGNLPLWMVALGSFVAIGIAKIPYGGIGNNPFNPALIGRVFLLVSFPVAMTSWPKPFAYRLASVDGITGPTPLGILKEGLHNGQMLSQITTQLPSYGELFLGIRGGCIGEVSILALILGGMYLLWRKIITWHIPVSVLASAFLFAALLWKINPEQYADPVLQLMTGGLFLGAIFMATDYTTSPMAPLGMIIYGVAIGFLTIIIRVWGSYPEGMSFAILIMNGFTPLLNRYCKPHRFGE